MIDPSLFLLNLTLFVLAIFLGVELINKVPATLHTPLMSGANAVSGISVIGALSVMHACNDSDPASTVVFH